MAKQKTTIRPFSAPRHRSIAEVADTFLTQAAHKAAGKLLKKINATNLKAVATWADDIKPIMKNKPKDKDTLDFLAKFPNTREWHFVDLPIDADSYDTTRYAAFTRADDIVHTAVECINILLGKSKKFSKLNALRWLVHLVGDMHQPLHIACSYIDYSKTKPQLIFEKDEIINRQLLQKSDRGGNRIILPIGSKGKPLHSYWDSDLPAKDLNFSNAVPAAIPPVPKNKLVDLPAQWVGDNVKYAKEAYKGLTVTGKNAVSATSVDVSWDRVKYDKRCVPVIKELSLVAANRLAFLLNSIYS